jgi:hypothetical protein
MAGSGGEFELVERRRVFRGIGDGSGLLRVKGL